MSNRRKSDRWGSSFARRAFGRGAITFIEAMNSLEESVLWLEDTGKSGLVCLFANGSFLEKVGYSDAEIFGRPLAGFVDGDRLRALRGLMDPSRADGRSSLRFSNPIDMPFKDKGGRRIELSCHVFPCVLKGVRSVLLYCSESEGPLRARTESSLLYEEALDGMFTLHRSGRIRNANRKIEHLVGRREGELSAEYFSKFLPEKKTSRGLISFLNLCLKEGMENYPYYFSTVSQDGKEKHYAVRAVMSPRADSEIIVNIRDVSDVKRLENDLRESEHKYRLVVEQSRDIICVSLRDKVILANNVAYDLLGDQLRKDDVDWKDYVEKLVPEDRDRIISFLRAAFRNLVEGSGTGTVSTDFRLKDRNGLLRDMAIAVSAITFQSEKALLCTIRDITESKILEAKTKESMKLGTLAQFAATVAHEIRNPLEALTSAGLLLSRALNLEGENRQLLDVILNATNDINGVVNEFVTMSSRPVYQFLEADIKMLIASAIRNAKRLKSYDPRVSITASYRRRLPNIHCDVGQIHKTLVNVINNSVNAMPEGGTIEIRAERSYLNSQEALTVTIKDSGTGIAPEILSQIWEPFVTSRKKGMGLGLFLAKHCIEDHGGRIDIPASDERGTMVRIVLPLRPVEAK